MTSPPFSSDGAVVLPAHCGTAAAGPLHAALLAAAPGDTVVDASAAESVGQAVLQLLAAARADAARAGRGFALADPSPAFLDRVRRCRLHDALGLSLEDHAS